MPKSSVPVVNVTVPSALKLMAASSFTGGAQPAQLAALAALALAARETFVVGELKRVFGQGNEIAAVVIGGRRHLPRQFLRPNLITPPQCDAIDAHFASGSVDQSLHVIVALRPPGAAIGRHL